MSDYLNEGWRLARKPPEGWPTADDFAWFKAPAPEPEEGQALVETIYVSMDPYQWGRRRSGVEAPGDVCHGRTVSRVIVSRHPDYAEGDYVFNTGGWQKYALIGRDINEFNYMFTRKLNPQTAPLSTAIGVHGMLGLTAYSGLIVQCAPQPGETVVVSAASGGVGQVAGQLAKIYGARVVGVAGRQEKCDFVVNELGYNACVSHLSPNLTDELQAACPDGCDVYFENVGGKVFEAVLPTLNQGSRITVCGMITQYGNTDGKDAREVWQALGQPVFDAKDVTVHGLFVGNYVASHQAQFLEEMGGYLNEGRVSYREDRWEGLEKAPEAFMAMLKGGNFGKTIVVAGSE